MSTNLKFERNPSFPVAKALYLNSGWFWKMNVREWAMAQLDVVDSVAIDRSYVGATNNPGVIQIVEAVFKQLKGKVAPKCVVWFGGCNIGMNPAFCKLAAQASGCPVVAPVMVLTAQKFPKGYIDMVDDLGKPKVFRPDGSTVSISDLCALQASLNFSVPV